MATRDSSIIELQEQIKELKTSIKNQSKAFKESVMAKSYSDGLASSEEVNVLKEQHRMELESQKKELDDGWQDTVSTLKKRHDEDAKYFQQESKRLKAAITENEHKHQEITKEIEQKYKAALANEEKKIADMNAQLVTVNQDIAKNSEALDIAKKSTIEKIIECNHLNKVYTEQSERLEEIEKDFFEKSSQMMRLEMQIDQLTSKLNRKTEQLSDLETAHENIKALYDNLNTDFTIVQSQKDTCLMYI